MKNKLRSAVCTEGRRMAGARALWVANGMKREQFGKPIIAVVPWGHTNIPTIVQQVAKEIVGWNRDSIVRAIRTYAN